ncbi:MAG: LamG domain-containing protein, partial [candidate division KSB1 bacterium]|nr:LamG domain-containing protein [candidate division KSB1 bacterium]
QQTPNPQEEETAQAQKRYDEAIKAAEEAWAQAQKLVADGQAKSQEHLGQCQTYLVEAGLSTALIPAEILPVSPEGETGDEDPAQMLEQSLEAVGEARRVIRQAVDDLLRWRETWRRRRNWAIGIAVTAAFALLIGLSIHNAQVQEMSRQATAQAQATATAQARATATAQAEQATATAQARATATVRAIQATVSGIESRKQRVFGPSSGSLEHNAEDTLVSVDGAGVQLKNFICTVTFFNPYSTSEGNWDYGIFFRHTGGNKQYRLYVTSDGEWHLEFVDDPTWDTIASGHIDNLDTSPNGHNHLRVVVKDKVAYFYVNDVYVSTLDVSRKQVSGDVLVVTGSWGGDEITGKATKYADFTVWSLP